MTSCGKFFLLAFSVVVMPAVFPSESFSFQHKSKQKKLLLAEVFGVGPHMVVNEACTNEQLMWALKNARYKHQRRIAAEILGDRGEKKALPILLEVLKEPEEVVQKGVAEALAKIGDSTVIDDLIANAHHSDPIVREYSAYVLGWVSDKKDREVIDTLEEMTVDPVNTVRVETIYALYRIGSPTSKWVFLEGLTDAEPRVRMHSATALGGFKDKEAGSALVVALSQEGDQDVRRTITSALSKLGSDYALNALLETLPNEPASVRADIATELGETKSPRAMKALADLLIEDPSPDVRARSAEALRDAKARSAVPALAMALKDRVPIVRRPASEALVIMADASVMDPLIEALGDSDREVADNAARALIRLNSFSSIPGLITKVDSPNSSEAERAIAILEEITQKSYGLNPQKWKSWYEEDFKSSI